MTKSKTGGLATMQMISFGLAMSAGLIGGGPAREPEAKTVDARAISSSRAKARWLLRDKVQMEWKAIIKLHHLDDPGRPLSRQASRAQDRQNDKNDRKREKADHILANMKKWYPLYSKHARAEREAQYNATISNTSAPSRADLEADALLAARNLESQQAAATLV